MAECPLCISPLTEVEKQFYPCPCGYQICSYCFHKIIEETDKLCPLCRREYSSDAGTRIGPEYKPKTVQEAPPQQVAISHVMISPKIVQITGIPENIRSSDILRRQGYLGQYGKIESLAVFNDTPPFEKFALQPAEGSVYVSYEREWDALSCILALDGFVFQQSTLHASFGVTEQCQSFLLQKRCTSSNCMKLHRKFNSDDKTFQVEYINRKPDALSKALFIQRPANYFTFPKRSFGCSIFPAPRIIPGYRCPFLGGRLYASYPTFSSYLQEILANPYALPIQPQCDPRPLVSLADMFQTK